MAFKRAEVFAALLLFSVWGTAHAQDVTVKSPDGQVELSGTLLGFDGEFYRLDTVYGEMTIDGSGVRCEGPACPNLQDFVAEISISGSATMGAVLMPALIEGFGLRNGFRTERVPEEPARFTYQFLNETTNKLVADFQFRVTNTDEGFADLLANEADIVMALREIRASERQRARDAGMGDLTAPNRSRVLALDAVVPIVSSGNPVRSISPPQLAAIFAGEIVNCSDLGGPNAPIDLHLPSGQTGLGQAVEDQVMKPAKLKFGPNIVRHVRCVDLALAVAASPFAIGIASYAETGNTQVLTLRGECGFALRAARRTIKIEDYPLTAPMFL
jgi:phosphate transport system substrate-binding protein